MQQMQAVQTATNGNELEFYGWNDFYNGEEWALNEAANKQIKQ